MNSWSVTGSEAGRPVAASQSSMRRRRSGSEMCDARLDERNSIPCGIWRRQNSIGRPWTRTSTPAWLRCAAVASP